MKTNETKKRVQAGKKEKQNLSKPSNLIIDAGKRETIAVDQIDFSPFNRRRFFNQKALEELAADIGIHGLIHDLTVRPKPAGRFELIAGERRLRAARIAGLQTVPVRIIQPDDELVKEIVFAENIHRENPHPLDEAACIGDMQQDKKSIDEIAARLGKSKSFVYNRSKLVNLIEPIQEMFVAEKITTQQAMEIAGIAQESQQEFFDDYCHDWKEVENFQLEDCADIVNRFKYDLSNAPFDTKDKKILPNVGACTGCQFNTATLKTLFPELAKEAVCTNRSCYHQKCNVQSRAALLKIIKEVKPDAFLFGNRPAEELINLIDEMPGAGELPKYGRYEVDVINPPELPEKEDYCLEDDDENPVLDETGFNEAMEEYQSEMDEYNTLLQSGKALKAVLITQEKITAVMFTTETDNDTERGGEKKVTAKDVQAAIKAGTATPELLQAEIDRITARETKAKEIDQEKIQLKIHQQFEETYKVLANNKLTDADLVGTRLVIYKSLGYSTRQQVETSLFGENGMPEDKNLMEVLAGLTDAQFACMIRIAIAGLPESKYPQNNTGKCLYQMATTAGLDVKAIEVEQAKKAKERGKKATDRIKELNKRMERLKKAAA